MKKFLTYLLLASAGISLWSCQNTENATEPFQPRAGFEEPRKGDVFVSDGKNIYILYRPKADKKVLKVFELIPLPNGSTPNISDIFFNKQDSRLYFSERNGGVFSIKADGTNLKKHINSVGVYRLCVASNKIYWIQKNETDSLGINISDIQGNFIKNFEGNFEFNDLDIDFTTNKIYTVRYGEGALNKYDLNGNKDLSFAPKFNALFSIAVYQGFTFPGHGLYYGRERSDKQASQKINVPLPEKPLQLLEWLGPSIDIASSNNILFYSTNGQEVNDNGKQRTKGFDILTNQAISIPIPAINYPSSSYFSFSAVE